MKSKIFMAMVITFSIALAMSNPLAAQEHLARHHHYKLIDMGTFGGPEGYIGAYEYTGPFQNLNNAGTLASWADTSKIDPFGLSANRDENFCFNYDGTPCYASRAFEWQAGVRSELPGLHRGLSSAVAWISANGLN